MSRKTYGSYNSPCGWLRLYTHAAIWTSFVHQASLVSYSPLYSLPFAGVGHHWPPANNGTSIFLKSIKPIKLPSYLCVQSSKWLLFNVPRILTDLGKNCIVMLDLKTRSEIRHIYIYWASLGICWRRYGVIFYCYHLGQICPWSQWDFLVK